jgi:hypothetical protein
MHRPDRSLEPTPVGELGVLALTSGGHLPRLRHGSDSGRQASSHIAVETSNYKLIGIILLVGVLLAAIGFQIYGSGLVSTHPPPPPRIITIQGHNVTQTYGKRIVFHTVRILVLTSIALLGLACILRGRPSHNIRDFIGFAILTILGMGGLFLCRGDFKELC